MLSTEPNAFDNLVVNVKKLFAQFPCDQKHEPWQEAPLRDNPWLHRIYKMGLIPIQYRMSLWHLCRRTHVDLTWFFQFKEYWGQVLQGRGMWGVHDFFFLKNIYAMASASHRVGESSEDGLSAPDNAHLSKWQNPLVIAKLFHLVNKESFSHKLVPLLKMKKFHKGPVHLLEFGCGSAPIILSYFEFFKPDPRIHWTMADIEYLAFHYGCFRFRHCKNVHPVLLKHEDDFRLITEQKFDVIFCTTVFEHLNAPVRTIRDFYEQLNPGGLVVFDYVMTKVNIDKNTDMGLDHYEGHVQRNNVIDFMEKNFIVLDGGLYRDKTISLCVLQKK